MTRDHLTVHEEVLLLALHDQKGTPEHGMYPYALGGAMLAELALQERIAIRDAPGKGEKARVELVSEEPTGDEVLDEALARVKEAKRSAPPETWVQRFAGTKKLTVRIATALARRGILREREDQILILFRRTVWPTLDPGAERDLVERLRRAVLDETGEVDARTAVVVGLLHGAGMLESVFDKEERKRAKARIEDIASGDAAATATGAAVQAVAATLAATTALTAVMVTTTT